jgi:CubicO group peptidase (beta-lactamase class C family)
MNQPKISGDCTPKFKTLRDAFERNFNEQDELGASVCVYLRGEKVVDLWGGYADRARTLPWEKDTLANVWSTTKGMMALCIAHLHDRGFLNFSDPVVKYWPEFGARGKERVTIAQLFSHQAGLCGTSEPLSEKTILDTDAMAELLAAEPPHWPVGTRSGYHAISIGPLADGLVKRVTGKRVGEYFRDEIGIPFGIDFHMGLSLQERQRTAELTHDGGALLNGPDSFNEYQRLALVNHYVRYDLANEQAWQAQGTPSAGGHGNARSVAKVFGSLAHDRRIDGRELLSREALEAATTIQIDNEDLVLLWPMTWGIGFAINKGFGAYGPSPNAFGHNGRGGSFGFADPDRQLGVAYAMNHMREYGHSGDPRVRNLIEALYASF